MEVTVRTAERILLVLTVNDAKTISIDELRLIDVSTALAILSASTANILVVIR